MMRRAERGWASLVMVVAIVVGGSVGVKHGVIALIVRRSRQGLLW